MKNMEILLNKSVDNYEAAKLLVSNKFYNTSIHCAYYSCYQMMKHILLNVLMCPNELPNNNENDSHNKLINFFEKEISSKHRFFAKNIRELKKLRRIADYEEEEITLPLCNRAIYLTEQSTQDLRKNFKI